MTGLVPPVSVGLEVGSADMVRMSREARGWTMRQLAATAQYTYGHVSRVESGSLVLAGASLVRYCRALECPPDLLASTYRPRPAEGAHFRRQAGATVRSRRQANAWANLRSLSLSRLLSLTTPSYSLAVPALDPDGLGGSGSAAARAVRRRWELRGPVMDLVALVEAAGVFVMDADLDRTIDAVTVAGVGELPAVVLLRRHAPSDRRRMTLAHELGHLVMDGFPTGDDSGREARADEFAAELLAPYADVRGELRSVSGGRLGRLEALRAAWGVSVPALTVHAYRHGLLSRGEYAALFRLLNANGLVHGERPGVQLERPRMVGRLIDSLLSGYAADDLSRRALMGRPVFDSVFQVRQLAAVGPARPARRALYAV